MEIQHIDEAVESVLKAHEISAYFSEKELKNLGNQMTAVITKVLGRRKVEKITFHEDDQMFFDLKENFIHLGLGLMKEVLDFWFNHLTANGAVFIPRDMIQEEIIKTFRAVAAHEAGHRVADCHPIEELGMSPEEWGSLGISSLHNMLMDIRNNNRIKKFHPENRDDMKSMEEYATSPGGRYDWAAKKEDELMRYGHNLLFPQFECESYRWSTDGQIHPETDERVRRVLEDHQDNIRFIAGDKSCVPGKDPEEIEKKSKARNAYRRIGKINNGDYQTVLIKTDRENQTVHQAISIVGLHEKGDEMAEELRTLITDELAKLDPELKKELDNKLAEQKKEKIEYDKAHQTVEKIQEQTHEAAAGKTVETGDKTEKTGDQSGETSEKTGEKVETDETDEKTGEKSDETAKKPESYFDLLGPAVRVEELSQPLRKFLMELFEKMQEKAASEMLQRMLQEILKKLLEDPEKFLKEVEDELNKKFRPQTKPATAPTHEEMEEQAQKQPQPGTQGDYKVTAGSGGFTPVTENLAIDTREFAEIENWLDSNFNMLEIIRRWQKAIKIVTRTGSKLTDEPTGTIDFEEYVHDEIAKEAGMKLEGKIFVEDALQQIPMRLSILWRTQNVNLQDALKMALFLMRIYSDPIVRRYLRLELLVSQHINVKKDQSDPSPVPIIFSFSDDPVQDYEKILENLKALYAAGGSSISISQDATALRTQRERITRQGSRNAFCIDLWDEAAIEIGSPDPMRAVKREIGKTQEALNGKAFCFILGCDGPSPDSPAREYGKDHFLAEGSTVELMKYLDIVIRCMIQYKENYALKIQEMAREELGLEI